MISVVNDMLDLKLIEKNKFVQKNEAFSPKDTFNFILNMFAPVVKVHNAKLKICSTSILREAGDNRDRMLRLVEE